MSVRGTPRRIVRGYAPGDEAAVRAVMEASAAGDPLPGQDARSIEVQLVRIAATSSRVLVAVDDGRVAGYCAPWLNDLTVAPADRRRGHGRRLVAGALGLVRDAGLPYLTVHVARGHADAEAFARALGFAYRSSLWQFVLRPGSEVPAPRFPEDVDVRPLRPGIDEPALVGVINASFRDHPEPLELSEDHIRRVHALPGFDPDSIRLVRVAGSERPIAFARVTIDRRDGEPTVGDVAMIGVRPAWRRRGLGRELLRWSVGWLRTHGAARIELAVEAANEGAAALYREHGFEPGIEWPHWVLPV